MFADVLLAEFAKQTQSQLVLCPSCHQSIHFPEKKSSRCCQDFFVYQFNITMDDVFRVQLIDSLKQLFHNRLDCFLLHSLNFIQILKQLALKNIFRKS
jgi:hypothetical protein